ncbi:deoxyribonuclease I [Bathymodiolus platifrons methanotrophic gill symbiont]|uniref:endonuclease n=2 Tax=Bathymodiolus platifrons methanotrophic gill symbiont TaxID=113268 RepID=UPI000B6CD0E1|nr:endonuclease [Bathymodiolus platifrons methanotrophic gill symbiont]GAW87150.1 deoxyribonuclease I [Bathymodiolus platifrons methanotrophic gill symbiont]GFO77287.1 deoxyribonuclease I [Bathymodiolus platifrons methanotrophic gill symbiont]GFO77854.1 deoxyribonuclease I [Bathymodiolus platifrons methanotrophic gill symbiont]
MARISKLKGMNTLIASIAVIASFSIAANAFSGHPAGNTENQSFSKSKKTLELYVYNQLPHETIYCKGTFEGKEITDPNGFYSDKYKKRAKRLEWEHVVPAENFGRAYPAWRNGDAMCITKKGKRYKGRRCATKVSKDYRYMQADLYNLYPSIGTVNALRSNYRYGMVEGESLGNCLMTIQDRKAEPPNYAKGVVARVALYFDAVYPKYTLSDSQRQLFNAWDGLYPVTELECKRSKIIEGIQGNVNPITSAGCK